MAFHYADDKVRFTVVHVYYCWQLFESVYDFTKMSVCRTEMDENNFHYRDYDGMRHLFSQCFANRMDKGKQHLYLTSVIRHDGEGSTNLGLTRW